MAISKTDFFFGVFELYYGRVLYLIPAQPSTAALTLSDVVIKTFEKDS